MARASLIFWVLLFVFAPFVWAQSINDDGVYSFTMQGTFACFQEVALIEHPDYLSVNVSYRDDGQMDSLTLHIFRDFLDFDDLVYNSLGHKHGDEIIFRFANGDVVHFDVIDASSPPIRRRRRLDFQQRAFIYVDQVFLERLVSQTDDVRFRLSASDGRKHDDTLPVAQLQPFRAFMDECLP